MPGVEDEAREAAEFTNSRAAAVAALQYAHATRGMDEVRAILADAGCLSPLFDEFLEGMPRRVAALKEEAASDPPA